MQGIYSDNTLSKALTAMGVRVAEEAEPVPAPGEPQVVVEHRGLNRAERRARQRAGYNASRAVNKPYRKEA